MKKTDLERAQRAYGKSFDFPRTLTPDSARAAVQADVKPAQDAYSAVGLLIEKLTAELQKGGGTLRDQQTIARTLKDAVSALVSLRQEARATAGQMTQEELMAFLLQQLQHSQGEGK